ncbi:MAG: 2-succinyl-5-enolpyruvyl-6-hydroxy-3-cyclohexene-1-carboxylic-acid synthase [Candidatus Hydrogenedens sp.]|jgi:2-succinyl-5-enolpyruvyl-6-hydroxy-3-cyclohexene-1-carboxylate synthase|nr:2-succinyl-5-enolpyruvyl-6-hydroxy-3-cyclohexene-1-carboxylic-acid synthase [Candidatus Hydrogenedens sp.]
MEYDSNLNMLWASLLMEEAARRGIRCVVIAPGSRSAPLAVAAWRNPSLKTVVHHDERGAAYFALGASRAGMPAAVVCTSGTAVANCFPAVAEANLSGLPLVIFSADRPPELQNCGANQTMDQEQFFGSHVRHALSLPCPDVSISPGTLLSRIDQALAPCFSHAPGPVHINCPFREPLAPVRIDQPWPPDYLDELAPWKNSSLPWQVDEVAAPALSDEELRSLLDKFEAVKNKAILLGSMHDPEDQEMALILGRKLGWPVFPDLLSGCRRKDLPANFHLSYDLSLKRGETASFSAGFEAVLHLGDSFLSKVFNEFLAKDSPGLYVHVHPRPEKRDPFHLETRHVQQKISEFCHGWLRMLEERKTAESPFAPPPDPSPAVTGSTEAGLCEDAALSEFSLASLLTKKVEADVALFLGNSMPVRYMDMQGTHCAAFLVHANRGVSGIDGNIATAAGIACGSRRRTAALLGDMSALHDLSSLPLLANSEVPVILIIVNNGGGGIFSHLPIAEFPEILIPCFIHPHEWEFKGLAHMFGLPWYDVRTVGDFERCWAAVQSAPKSCIIECRIDRESSLQACKKLICFQSERDQ